MNQLLSSFFNGQSYFEQVLYVSSFLVSKALIMLKQIHSIGMGKTDLKLKRGTTIFTGQLFFKYVFILNSVQIYAI